MSDHSTSETKHRSSHVVNQEDLDWIAVSSPDEHASLRVKPFGPAAGGQKLGCSLTEIPPGKMSFPYHYHTANEEAMYVMEGSGKLRLADQGILISEGDYISFPIGAEGAHRVLNDTEEPLLYLCFSTMIDPEIAVYPDSNKIGVFTGTAPGHRPKKGDLRQFMQMDATVDYWEGE